MRVLFALTVFLLLTGWPSFLPAADDAPPEQKAEALACSPGGELPPLVAAPLEQRLDRLEQILNSQQRAEERLDNALARMEGQTDRNISLISAGFTALGVCAGILALVGFGSAAYAIAGAKRTITDLKAKQAEAEAIMSRAREADQTLSALLSKHQPSERFTSDVLAKARESAESGTGIEVLRANAVLAQEEQRWRDALTYWSEVLREFPLERSALFGASLAALELAEKTTGEEQQQYVRRAEAYFRQFTPDQMSSEVLNNWGNLCLLRGKRAADSDDRKQCFAKAEEKYARAVSLVPDSFGAWNNWGNLCKLWGKAADNPESREVWFSRAEEKFARAAELAPERPEVWYNWGNLCRDWGYDAATPEAGKALFLKAGEKYARAASRDAGDFETWVNWGNLCLELGCLAADSDDRKQYFAKAEEKYARALEIKPKEAVAWYHRACLESLRGNPEKGVAYLEKWREYEPDASAGKLDGDKGFDAVRDTPEFKAFRKRMLTQAAESAGSE